MVCVEPDEPTRERVAEGLEAALGDPTIETTASVEGAAELLGGRDVDCVVTEYDVDGGSGFDVAARARELSPDASVVLFTHRDPDDLDTGGFGPTVAEYADKDASNAVERLAGLVEMTTAMRSQISYPLPEGEEARVETVEAYDLDSEALHRSLEGLTDLATSHFGVESASVNIIEERTQRLLACRGLELDVERMPREASICTFTILEEDGVMVVDDVREDPRFAPEHENLEAAGIRSYMGAKLVAPSGLSIGTLCIYDDEPRDFSAADRDYLRTLAALGMDLVVAHSRAAREVPGVEDGADGSAQGNTDAGAEDGGDGSAREDADTTAEDAAEPADPGGSEDLFDLGAGETDDAESATEDGGPPEGSAR